MSSSTAFPLKCAVQNYAWGKLGGSSEVACLAHGADAAFVLSADTPYAELWMGTHPKGPSVIASSGQQLSEWVSNHQKHLGPKVNARFSTPGQLPFLFKVLSVNRALSIQAHPNKAHAEKLHKEKPDKYPDPNHKPEMAIALTPFGGLCGFRPKEEIISFLKDVPEFGAVVGPSLVAEFQSAEGVQLQTSLRKCFTALMMCSTATVQQQLSALVARLQEAENRGEDTSASAGKLLLQLNSQFPGDVGCFAIYLLNFMKLQPGEAMFLEANLPHAYLYGDCIECMACSDNVVRAGLTPKFKDVEVLCEMLKYECKPACDNLFSSVPHPSDSFVTIYDPPVPDFTVCRIKLPEDVKSYTIGALDSASILLVIEGEGSASHESIQLHRGTVLFIVANEEVLIQVTSSGMLMFRAYCQL